MDAPRPLDRVTHGTPGSPSLGAPHQFAELSVTIGGMHRLPLKEVARTLFELLSAEPRIIDPIVSSDPTAGELSISFEMEGASGDAPRDIGRALSLLADVIAPHPALASEMYVVARRLAHPARVNYAGMAG